MELRQLEAFISIATLRSFRAAANRLNITQPAISLRLQALEEELGTQLICRTNSNIQLTSAGADLLQYAEQIVDTSKKLKATADGTVNSQRNIRLGATNTIASAWLPELVAEVFETMPSITLEVVMDTTRRLREILLAGELDIAIVSGPIHEKGIRSVPLKAYNNEWIASCDLAFPGSVLSLNELTQYPIITYARDSSSYSSLDELFRFNGLWPARLNSCSSSETIIQLAETGHAIGLISSACLEGRSRRVQILKCAISLQSYEFFAAYHLDAIGRDGMAISDLARKVCQRETLRQTES